MGRCFLLFLLSETENFDILRNNESSLNFSRMKCKYPHMNAIEIVDMNFSIFRSKKCGFKWIFTKTDGFDSIFKHVFDQNVTKMRYQPIGALNIMFHGISELFRRFGYYFPWHFGVLCAFQRCF